MVTSDLKILWFEMVMWLLLSTGKLSGWYPEYWEFAKALLIWGWQSDWTGYVVRILKPYHAEYFMHCFLMEKLLI